MQAVIMDAREEANEQRAATKQGLIEADLRGALKDARVNEEMERFREVERIKTELPELLIRAYAGGEQVVFLTKEYSSWDEETADMSLARRYFHQDTIVPQQSSEVRSPAYKELCRHLESLNLEPVFASRPAGINGNEQFLIQIGVRVP